MSSVTLSVPESLLFDSRELSNSSIPVGGVKVLFSLFTERPFVPVRRDDADVSDCENPPELELELELELFGC